MLDTLEEVLIGQFSGTRQTILSDPGDVTEDEFATLRVLCAFTYNIFVDLTKDYPKYLKYVTKFPLERDQIIISREDIEWMKRGAEEMQVHIDKFTPLMEYISDTFQDDELDDIIDSARNRVIDLCEYRIQDRMNNRRWVGNMHKQQTGLGLRIARRIEGYSNQM